MKATLLTVATVLLLIFTLNAQVENRPKTKEKKETVKFEKKKTQPARQIKANSLYERRHEKEIVRNKKPVAIREEKKKK